MVDTAINSIIPARILKCFRGGGNYTQSKIEEIYNNLYPPSALKQHGKFPVMFRLMCEDGYIGLVQPDPKKSTDSDEQEYFLTQKGKEYIAGRKKGR